MGQDRTVSTAKGIDDAIAGSADSEVPPEDLRVEYEDLADQVRRYRFAYYNEDAPLVSDAEFDELYRQLEDTGSPAPGTGHQRFAHPGGGRRGLGGVQPRSNIWPRMYSLEDVFSIEELQPGSAGREASVERIGNGGSRSRNG